MLWNKESILREGNKETSHNKHNGEDVHMTHKSCDKDKKENGETKHVGDSNAEHNKINVCFFLLFFFTLKKIAKNKRLRSDAGQTCIYLYFLYYSSQF